MSEVSDSVARSLALEKAYVHQVYQQISDATDTLPDRGRAWPKVKQFLSDLEPGSLVCDVGCGNGKYLDVNPSIFEIGVDRCKRLTEVAREKDHEVLICDNLALPFRDESFDAVLSIAVVHHFATTDRRVQALRELARVLKIGGKLIISVWAMEQRHRKFESQDVLVPWHKPQQLSTPSLEFTSTTTTTTTSEDDGPPPYHAYTQTSDSESTRSHRGNSGVRKRGRHWPKGRSIDPSRPISSSQSSSSLSSPNETCYSFVRRALQKLAGGKRGSSGRHRPWFLDTWTTCTKEPPPRRYDPDGCEDVDAEDIQDLPIELRRLEEETDLPLRRQTFVCSQKLSSSIDISLGYKSKSLTDILTVNQKCLVRSRSSASNLGSINIGENAESTGVTDSKATTTATTSTTTTTTTTTAATVISSTSIGTTVAIGKSGTAPPAATANHQATVTKVLAVSVITSQPKPKLVKQKQSLCEEEMEEESGDLPTDMKDLVKRLPEFKVTAVGESRKQSNVFKQSSMNEELMSTERLREKEIVRQNIQKQASLNEEFLFRRQRTFDSIRDSIFSTSTARRFQILKDGLTSKIKSSTTGIEKVAGASFKNGFVRILQGWKSEGPGFPGKAAPATPPPSDVRRTYNFEEKAVNGNGGGGGGGGGHCAGGPAGERRHSKEDGSDSSKDSSLQSDTSVDSEDSFASVIFIPKPDQTSETSPPMNTSPPSVALTSPTFHSLPQSPQPTSPKFKGSLPPSPKFKYHSPTSPIIKQPSLPCCKYQSPTSPILKTQFPTSPLGLTKQHSLPTSPKCKYSLPPLSPSLGNKTNDAQLNFQQKLNQLTSLDKGPWTVPPARQNPNESEAATSDRSSFFAASAGAEAAAQGQSFEKAGEPSEIADSKKVSPDEGTLTENRGAVQAQTFDVATPNAVAHPREGVQPRQQCFPIVRRPAPASGCACPGRQENLAKPLPKLLSLELFNPETDDVDSDSSGVSSPDSISSVISVLTEELSAESHVSDVQQAKRSPSDGQSNSNSANDSDLNLSDQSLSSLPNSKSPELTNSKMPENPGKSGGDRIKVSDSSSGSRHSDAKKFEALKPAKSPDNLSSSSDSLSKSPDMQKESEESTKADPSSEAEDVEPAGEEGKVARPKSPDLSSVKRRGRKQGAPREGVFKEIFSRKRDEKFVAAACETESNSSRRRNLIEAAADVASSLEGAVDAVIQSSPRATKRRQMETTGECSDSKWVVVVGDCSSSAAATEREDSISKIFKKCELKQTLKVRPPSAARNKSPEYVPSHDEPYPDFKFCKIKCHEDWSKRPGSDRHRSSRDRLIPIEKVPLLGSHESDGGRGRGSCERCECEFSPGQRSEAKRPARDGSRREMEIVLSLPRSVETGSSWSLGRSERFYHSLMEAEREETRRHSSTWSLNRYRCKSGGDAHAKSYLFKGKRETSPWPASGAVRGASPPAGGSCRSIRSHSLSLGTCGGEHSGGRADDRLSESWGEEYRQNLANFADKLSKKLTEEIDNYREETDSKHIYSSLPSGLERAEDPYLERLSAQLVDLNRLSAELRQRNNTRFRSGFTDEDANPEFQKSTIETNPFLPCSLDGAALTPPPSSAANPFLGDESESERSKSDDSDSAVIKTFPSVLPEVASGGKGDGGQSAAQEAADRRLDAETACNGKSLPDDSDRRSVKSSGSWKPSRDKRKTLLFVKSASLDDSYRFLDKCRKTGEDEASTASARPAAATPNASTGDGTAGARAEPPAVNRSAFKISSRENSRRNSGKTHSAENGCDSVTDSCGASRKSTRMPSWESSVDTDPGPPGLQRDLSKITIASSLGYSMESSDPEASGGTGSGSDCSRRDASRVTASTTSLGHSIESSDPGDVSERTGSVSDFSRKETSSAGTGPTADSTASFGHESGSDCSKDTGYGDRRVFRCDARSSSEEMPRRIQLVRQKSAIHEPVETLAKTESFDTSLNGSTSQESLPSDNGGGAITFHRYYHVFREGELDQLIEKYVDNLHIISSYYDHANWCVIAEKVHVWTI